MRSNHPHDPVPEPLIDGSTLACHPHGRLWHPCQGDSFPYGQDGISILLLTREGSTAMFAFWLLDWAYLCAGSVDAGHEIERHAYFHPGIALLLVLPKLVCLLLKLRFSPRVGMRSAPWMGRRSRLHNEKTCYKTQKTREESASWTSHGHLVDLILGVDACQRQSLSLSSIAAPVRSSEKTKSGSWVSWAFYLSKRRYHELLWGGPLCTCVSCSWKHRRYAVQINIAGEGGRYYCWYLGVSYQLPFDEGHKAISIVPWWFAFLFNNAFPSVTFSPVVVNTSINYNFCIVDGCCTSYTFFSTSRPSADPLWITFYAYNVGEEKEGRGNLEYFYWTSFVESDVFNSTGWNKATLVLKSSLSPAASEVDGCLGVQMSICNLPTLTTTGDCRALRKVKAAPHCWYHTAEFFFTLLVITCWMEYWDLIDWSPWEGLAKISLAKEEKKKSAKLLRSVGG